ncbi:MAG TPA: hypothetical protein VGG99_08215 [Acetobacteraceae bacterium]
MENTIDVTIPVDPEIAETLRDARNRVAVGRRLSRVLRPLPSDDALPETIVTLSAEIRVPTIVASDQDLLSCCIPGAEYEFSDQRRSWRPESRNVWIDSCFRFPAADRKEPETQGTEAAFTKAI